MDCLRPPFHGSSFSLFLSFWEEVEKKHRMFIWSMLLLVGSIPMTKISSSSSYSSLIYICVLLCHFLNFTNIVYVALNHRNIRWWRSEYKPILLIGNVFLQYFHTKSLDTHTRKHARTSIYTGHTEYISKAREREKENIRNVKKTNQMC